MTGTSFNFNFGNISNLSQPTQNLIKSQVYPDFDKTLLKDANTLPDATIETKCRSLCTLLKITDPDQKILSGVKSLLTDLEKLTYEGKSNYVVSPIWMKFRNDVVLYDALLKN